MSGWFQICPWAKIWAFAKASAGVLVPLRSHEICCGVVTIVSTQMLGIPILTGRSFMLFDYLESESGTEIYSLGDPEAWLKGRAT